MVRPTSFKLLKLKRVGVRTAADTATGTTLTVTAANLLLIGQPPVSHHCRGPTRLLWRPHMGRRPHDSRRKDPSSILSNQKKFFVFSLLLFLHTDWHTHVRACMSNTHTFSARSIFLFLGKMPPSNGASGQTSGFVALRAWNRKRAVPEDLLTKWKAAGRDVERRDATSKTSYFIKRRKKKYIFALGFLQSHLAASESQTHDGFM